MTIHQNIRIMNTKEVLFPVAIFSHKGRKIIKSIVPEELPTHDNDIGWWDYWFTIGAYTYQLCGDYKHPHRMINNLVVYVHHEGHYYDEERIETIEDVKIEFRALGYRGFIKAMR